MTLTPGAYLKCRRTAAGLSVHDVAARVPTEPHIAEHLHADWIEKIEADVMPASFNTVVALHRAFPFDLFVLKRLAEIHLGAALAAPRLCRICACSEFDACVRDWGCCSWSAIDLCSSCAGSNVAAADRLPAARTARPSPCGEACADRDRRASAAA